MCGITGIINNTQKDVRQIVYAMTDTLVHRGPDDFGITSVSSGNIVDSDSNLFSEACFGHRRLSIIDIDHGHQPMASDDGRYVLTFNGEIYNYLELRQKLSNAGVTFKTHSDTEVLLQLLIAKGEQALDELNGMFAFSFYDTQSRQYLLARDHFGIKPLYYAELKQGGLIFASEIKALLKHPDVKSEVNRKALNQYFTFQFCLNSKTLFDGIHKLEPGCLISGDCSGLSVKRYWDIDYTIDSDHTEDYFKDKLLSLLEDSSRLQIRSDVPVGTYLSGGLDSSVISSMASDHLGGNIPVFTGKFAEDARYDESGFAKILAQDIGADYNEIIPTAQEFVDYLPKLIYALDEPVAGPGVFPQYCVSKFASEKVKVILGGQGGDELFGGYARYLVGYLEQALKGAIFENQEEGKHIVSLESIVPNLPLLQQYKPLMQQFWSGGLFEDMGARYFQLINRSPDISQLLSKEMLAGFNEQETFAEFQGVFNHPDTKSYVNKMTHFDQKTLLPALLQVEDRVSMSVSLESRVPLLDKRIVELVASMPPPMKFQGGKTKHIFKQAVKNVVPETILKRKDKMGFPVPLKEWMQKGPVREFVADILLGEKSRQRGLFKVDAIENLMKTEGAFGRQLWGALCTELWHREFID